MSRNQRTDPQAAQKIRDRLKRNEHLIKPMPTSADMGGKQEVFQATCRGHLVKDLLQRADVLASPPKIFISFSDTALHFYNRAKKFFEKGDKFKVLNWRDDRSGESNISDELPQQIAACSCFLGIWVEPNGKRRKTNSRVALAPSPWMPYELGLGRGSGAICSLLVHDDIDEKFLREPNIGKYNYRFNPRTFQDALKIVEASFENQLKHRRPRWTLDSPLDQNYFEGSKAKYWPS